MKMIHPRTLLTLTLFSLAGLNPLAVSAQNNNQWVISAPSVPLLRDKIVDTVGSLLDRKNEDLEAELTKESPGAILVDVDSLMSGGPSISNSDSPDVCKMLLDEERRQRRAYAEGDSKLPPRHYSCSPNGTLSLLATPNDPLMGNQWAINQSNNVDMNLNEAWDITKGSSNVIVAVIDSGVDYLHPDLEANIWTNPGEIPGDGIDNDHNGYIDDVHGINAITHSGDPMDDHGHGTHVSGTIGASTNNSVGVAGVNWNVKIVGAKFLSSTGSGSLFDAITAIDYVTDLKNRGYNVILSNNSWGGGGFYSPLRDAIVRAANANLLFVAAAGNSGLNIDTSPSYPAGYDVDNIVSVAAVDSSGGLAYFSNYGATNVDIGAPGVNISSTYSSMSNGQLVRSYTFLNGTSMASPHVAGAIALFASLYGSKPYATVINALLGSGKPLSSLQGKTKSGKLVDAYAFLNAGGPTPTPTPVIPTPTPTMTPTPTPTRTPTPTATPTSTPTPHRCTVTGKAVDPSGLPMAGAQINLKINGVTTSKQSDASGQAIFNDVMCPTTIEASAAKAGFAFAPYTTSISGSFTFTLVSTANSYSLGGLVLKESDGSPISGMTVTLNGTTAAVTNSSGRFSFPVAYGANYKLRINSNQYEFISNEATGTVYGDVSRVFVGH